MSLNVMGLYPFDGFPKTASPAPVYAPATQVQIGTVRYLGPMGVVSAAEPNPLETVWTLGVGGVPTAPVVGQGKSLLLATTLLNNGATVTMPTGTTLSAAVWPGANQAVSFNPTVAFVSGSTSQLTLTITDTMSNSVSPGLYFMQVTATYSGVDYLCYNGTLEVLYVPGSGTLGTPWVQESDMLLYSDAIQSLQAGPRTNDATGFLSQRMQATQKLLLMIDRRYQNNVGMYRVRQNTPDPIVGQDVPSQLVPPSRYDITTALSTPGGLVLDIRIKEIAARMAVALVLRRQVTGGSGRNYLDEANAQEAMADELFCHYQANIITAAPIGGISQFLIHTDAIGLPTGTAP